MDRIEALPTDAWLYPAACLRLSDSLSQTKRCSAGESLSSLTTRFAYSRESDECLLDRIQRSGFRLSNLRRDGAPTRCSAMLWQFGKRCPNAYCVRFPDCFRTWRDDHDPRRRARPVVPSSSRRSCSLISCASMPFPPFAVSLRNIRSVFYFESKACS